VSSTRQAQGQGTAYELSVAGPLGPALRATLAAAAVVEAETSTLRARLSTDGGLEHLLELLDAGGVEVQAAFRLGASYADSHSLISDDAGPSSSS
jgi:hypothetical protein